MPIKSQPSNLIIGTTAQRNRAQTQSSPQVGPEAVKVSDSHSSQPFLTTNALAPMLGVAAQTLRKRYSQSGSYFSVRPFKLPNGRLLWPHDTIEQLVKVKLGDGS